MADITATTILQKVDWEFFSNNTLQLPFTLKIGNTPLKLSECVDIYFTLKLKQNDADSVLQKTYSANDGSVVAIDDTNGIGQVVLPLDQNPTITKDTPYWYDLVVIESKSIENRVTTVMWGTLKYYNNVTKLLEVL